MQPYPAAGEQKTVAEFLHSATVPFFALFSLTFPLVEGIAW